MSSGGRILGCKNCCLSTPVAATERHSGFLSRARGRVKSRRPSWKFWLTFFWLPRVPIPLVFGILLGAIGVGFTQPVGIPKEPKRQRDGESQGEALAVTSPPSTSR